MANDKFRLVLNTRDPSPCYQCPDRYLACSDHCKKPEYLNWKAEIEMVKANRKAYEQDRYSRACARRRYKN